MWPKRKKGKARATKVKLKALQPTGDQTDENGSGEEVEAPQPEEPVRNEQDDLISGVWKSKVLSNYKKNPRDSHNLLAKIPQGKAAFEAGERQKQELIKEVMIKIVDRMFDSFQNTAYEFNQVTGGSDLELTWIRPTLIQEDVSAWHESARVQHEVFSGRISTRYWTLAVRGTSAGIGTYILPTDKMLGFSTSPSQFPCYLSVIPESDGFSVNWKISQQPIDPDLFPNVYRALLDGLIRYASEEAAPGETFRLEDIGLRSEEPAAVAAVSGHDYKETEKYDLWGQSSAAHPSLKKDIISDISSQIGHAAELEAEQFRESMQISTDSSTSGSRQFKFSGSEDSGGEWKSSNDGEWKSASNDGEWKSVSSSQTAGTNWRKYMETAQEQIRPAAPAHDERAWNTVPGTEQILRNDQVSRTSIDGLSTSPSPPPTYPSYGSASDAPELLRPDQTGGYPIHQSGSFSAQQSGAFSTQHPGAMPPPAVQQIVPPSHSGPQMAVPPPQGMVPQAMPPGMMPPGIPGLPAMIQPGQPMPPGMHPGIMPPGINPAQIYPPGMQPGMPPHMMPPGVPPHLVPNPMVNGQHGMPSGTYSTGHPQYNTGPHAGLPPHVHAQYNTGPHAGMQPPNQHQYNTGQQQGLPPYNTPQQQQPGIQPPQGQYNTGQHAGVAPPVVDQYNTGQHQQPAGYNPGPYGTVSGRPIHDPRAFRSPEPVEEDHVPYLLSESDFEEQQETSQYPEQSGEFPPYDQDQEPAPAEETLEVEQSYESSEELAVPTLKGFPQESSFVLPVMNEETVERFNQARETGFVFSPESDLVDAISVVLSTIDSQIELLTQQGAQAFSEQDFQRAQKIIKLSERLSSFKTEAQTIYGLLSKEEQV